MRLVLVAFWESRLERAIRGYVDRFASLGRPMVGPQSQVVLPPHGLTVQTRQDTDTVVVALVGEFDLPVVPLAREAFARAMQEPGRRLIIDLSGLTFIDSSGLHALLQTAKRCREAGRVLTIRPGPPNVQKVFELTNTIASLPFAGKR